MLRVQFIQLLVSLLLIVIIVAVVFVFIFKGGNLTHKEFWHIILWLSVILVIILNLRPHWSVEKKHRQFFEDFVAQTDSTLQRLLFGTDMLDSIDGKYRPYAKMLGKVAPYGITGNNSIEIITDGERKYELLMRDMEQATESIHMEYFNFGRDSGSRAVRDMLIKKAQEGVRVKFINENVANIFMGNSYYRMMKKSGVEVIRFNKLRNFIGNFLTKINYRNHRKIVVIDGKIGYTGGMNINDHYFHQWRDTHLRMEGDAVSSLQLIFLNSWVTSGGTLDAPMQSFFSKPDSLVGNRLVQVVADEPGLNPHPIQLSYEWALMHAEDYFYIQTPYFVPTPQVLDALKSAALSGVDVRVMLPEENDTFYMAPANESYYKECMEAGVRFFLRKGNFIHSKTFVSDDYLSCIGTANMDYRSFTLNYEDNVYLYDGELAQKNKEIFFNDLQDCTEVTLEEVRGWKWFQRLPKHLIRIFAPLL